MELNSMFYLFCNSFFLSIFYNFISLKQTYVGNYIKIKNKLAFYDKRILKVFLIRV